MACMLVCKARKGSCPPTTILCHAGSCRRHNRWSWCPVYRSGASPHRHRPLWRHESGEPPHHNSADGWRKLGNDVNRMAGTHETVSDFDGFDFWLLFRHCFLNHREHGEVDSSKPGARTRWTSIAHPINLDLGKRNPFGYHLKDFAQFSVLSVSSVVKYLRHLDNLILSISDLPQSFRAGHIRHIGKIIPQALPEKPVEAVQSGCHTQRRCSTEAAIAFQDIQVPHGCLR